MEEDDFCADKTHFTHKASQQPMFLVEPNDGETQLAGREREREKEWRFTNVLLDGLLPPFLYFHSSQSADRYVWLNQIKRWKEHHTDQHHDSWHERQAIHIAIIHLYIGRSRPKCSPVKQAELLRHTHTAIIPFQIPFLPQHTHTQSVRVPFWPVMGSLTTWCALPFPPT